MLASFQETNATIGIMFSPLRFSFGQNWLNFLPKVNDDRINVVNSFMTSFFGVDSLCGSTFLDVGSGSGLFSLSARYLGAYVHSFDYDVNSVLATSKLKSIYFPEDCNWIVEQGDVLDTRYLACIGSYDYVLCWGSLHHTGSLYKAIDNSMNLVDALGSIYIAIYNDQGFKSCYWLNVKRMCSTPFWGRLSMIILRLPYLGAVLLFRFFTSRLKLERGMSYWTDYIDWLGGLRFEVAKPDDIVTYFLQRGFVLKS